MFSDHSSTQRNRSHDGGHASSKYFPKLSAIIGIILLFVGCETKPQPKEFSGVMMHIPYRILVGDALASSQEEKIQAVINETFHQIDHIYNNWNPSSEISFLSHLPAGKKVNLSPELGNLLKKVDELYHQSEGRFDITIDPIAKLWKKGKPTSEKLHAIIKKTGWNKVHFEENHFWKDYSDITFDLGGIAKGYAVDLLIENLQQSGFHHVFVEWGGEISTRGSHPSGRPWKVGVKNKNIVVDLKNQAIATSGGDFQFWNIDGIDYMHIINPKTHAPLINKSDSITIMAPTCMLADALATILMIFDDPQEAKNWLSLYYPEAKML